jgi:hypothetical protein
VQSVRGALAAATTKIDDLVGGGGGAAAGAAGGGRKRKLLPSAPARRSKRVQKEPVLSSAYADESEGGEGRGDGRGGDDSSELSALSDVGEE